MTQATHSLTIDTGLDYPEIREGVKRVCADFPGSYWRGLEEKLAYPTEFVQALTASGYLGALIPEEYGGSGMPLRAAVSGRLSTRSRPSLRPPLPCAATTLTGCW